MDMSKVAATVGTRVFEAKAGIKPAVCAVKLGEDIVGRLVSAPGGAEGADWLLYPADASAVTDM